MPINGETKTMNGTASTAAAVAAENVAANDETKKQANGTTNENGSVENGTAPPATTVAAAAAADTTISPDPSAFAAEGVTIKKTNSAPPSEIGTEDDFKEEDDVDAEEEELFQSLEKHQTEEELEVEGKPQKAVAPALLKAAIEAGEVDKDDIKEAAAAAASASPLKKAEGVSSKYFLLADWVLGGCICLYAYLAIFNGIGWLRKNNLLVILHVILVFPFCCSSF